MCRWSSERERARDVVDDDRSTEDSGPPRAGVDDDGDGDGDDDDDDDDDDGDDDDAVCVPTRPPPLVSVVVFVVTIAREGRSIDRHHPSSSRGRVIQRRRGWCAKGWARGGERGTRARGEGWMGLVMW